MSALQMKCQEKHFYKSAKLRAEKVGLQKSQRGMKSAASENATRRRLYLFAN